MFLIVVIVSAIFGVLWVLAGREKVPEGIGTLLVPFYKVAGFLYRKMQSRILGTEMWRRVAGNLTGLNPGKPEAELLEEYYVKKIALSLLVIVLGTCFGMGASVSARSGVILEENGLLRREEYPEQPRKIKVNALWDGLRVTLPIDVNPRTLQDEEAEEMLMRLEAELPALIVGENEDLRNVRKDLVLLDCYEGFPAAVEWRTDSPESLGSSGEVKETEEVTQVLLTARLCYGEHMRECPLHVTVLPPVLTAEEELQRELEKVLHSGDEETSAESEWQLPGSWKGTEIQWEQVVSDNGPMIWLGALGVSALLYFCSDRDLEDKLRKRRDEMRRGYPEIVHKLVLFAEAGMTLRGAFQKIAGDYERRRTLQGMPGKKAAARGDPAYEEMIYACNELNAGISEGAVYERLGKRIALQEYIRLGTLMSQNLRRGNAALLGRLREEADKASQEQLHLARKAGEEAGTKLLVPMVLQLAVVMVMIMVPVFLDM